MCQLEKYSQEDEKWRLGKRPCSSIFSSTGHEVGVSPIYARLLGFGGITPSSKSESREYATGARPQKLRLASCSRQKLTLTGTPGQISHMLDIGAAIPRTAPTALWQQKAALVDLDLPNQLSEELRDVAPSLLVQII